MKKLLMALLAVVIMFAIMDIAYAGGGGKPGSGSSNPGGGGGTPPGGGGSNPGGGGGTPPGGSKPVPMPVPPGGRPGGGSDPGGGGNQPGGGGNDPGQPPAGGGSNPGGGGKPGNPAGIEEGKKNAADPAVIKAVRTLRKLMHTLRLMIEKKADEKKIEKVEEKIRKIIEWLKKQDIKWRKMNNHQKCNLDPDIAKLIRALEWLRNEIKGMDPEKDKNKIARAQRKINRIMKALRKMHIGNKDLPDCVKPDNDDDEEEEGNGKGDCPKHDGKGDCPKGDDKDNDDGDSDDSDDDDDDSDDSNGSDDGDKGGCGGCRPKKSQ